MSNRQEPSERNVEIRKERKKLKGQDLNSKISITNILKELLIKIAWTDVSNGRKQTSEVGVENKSERKSQKRKTKGKLKLDYQLQKRI